MLVNVAKMPSEELTKGEKFMRPTHYFFILAVGLSFFMCVGQPSVQAGDQPDPNPILLDYAIEHGSVIAPLPPVTISQAKMYQDRDQLIVSGRVRRMHEVRLPGHIDLTVRDASGKVLSRDTTRVAGLNSNRKGRLTLPFRFSLATVPPQGAKISLRYHDHSAHDEILNCPKS